MKAANQLFEKTETQQQVREVVSLDRKHDDFLAALIEEVQHRTRHRINKSSIVRTLIESIMEAGLEREDITNVYRRERGAQCLIETKDRISEEIADIEAELRLALIDYASETIAVRQLRRNLRYQKQRLRAVDMQMKMEEKEPLTSSE